MVLNKLRARVCTKVLDFIKQMKQTNLWKRSLIKKTTKMKESIPVDIQAVAKQSDSASKDLTLSPRSFDIIAGYSRKLEDVGRLSDYDVDLHKIRYL